MKFEEMLLQRESCRAYQNKPVSRKDLLKICEAGRLTPSTCNSQPWKFLLIDEPEALAKMYDVLLVEDNKTGAVWREQCLAFIVFVEQKAQLTPGSIEYYKDSQHFAQGDIAMASLNMCYQALELGLSTCLLGLIDREKMQKHFHIPEDQKVHLALAVGYGASQEEARPKVRKSLEEVVCINEWK